MGYKMTMSSGLHDSSLRPAGDDETLGSGPLPPSGGHARNWMQYNITARKLERSFPTLPIAPERPERG